MLIVNELQKFVLKKTQKNEEILENNTTCFLRGVEMWSLTVNSSPKDALPTKCDLPPISSATENNAVDKYDIDFELPTNFKRGPYVFDSGASAS